MKLEILIKWKYWTINVLVKGFKPVKELEMVGKAIFSDKEAIAC